MAICDVTTLTAADDPEEAAEEAGLRYVSDQQPGIRRRRRGRGFSYHDEEGQPLRSRSTLDRIKRLAVPPAWTDVWICSDPRGHLQATGRDDRNRKQYRYHDDWRKVRDANKYDRLFEFGTALGPLRAEVDDRLACASPTRDTVLAAIVHLLDSTLARVGNAEYAHDNETFGLTTLRDDHVDAGQQKVAFHFVGKHGQEHEMTIHDPNLARVVRGCHELGGKGLFTYAGEDGTPTKLTSQDVNDYLREVVGAPGLSAKDFRTWGGTVAVAETLAELGPPSTARQLEHNILEAIDEAAARLHNTRAVCRSCYAHPAIIDAYRDDRLLDLWKHSRSSRWYSRAERATLLTLDPSTSQRRAS